MNHTFRTWRRRAAWLVGATFLSSIVALSPDSPALATSYGVAATILVGTAPSDVAVTPDGTKAYVTNYGSNTVTVIDTATDTVSGSAINVGLHPTSISIHPTNGFAYVTNAGESGLAELTYISTSTSVTSSADAKAPNLPETNFDEPVAIAIGLNGENAVIAHGDQEAVILMKVQSGAPEFTSFFAHTDYQDPDLAGTVEPIAVAASSFPYYFVVSQGTNTTFGNGLQVYNQWFIQISSLDFNFGSGSYPTAVAVTPTDTKGFPLFITLSGTDQVVVIDEVAATEEEDEVIGGSQSSRPNRSRPTHEVSLDPSGGSCTDNTTPWTVQFRGSYDLPTTTECLRDGHVLLGWTRNPALTAPENLLTTVVARSGTLTAVWAALPDAPGDLVSFSNFFCEQCTSAIVSWPDSPTPTDTTVITVDEVETSCAIQLGFAGRQWCLLTGLSSGSTHSVAVAWRNQYGTGAATSTTLSLR